MTNPFQHRCVSASSLYRALWPVMSILLVCLSVWGGARSALGAQAETRLTSSDKLAFAHSLESSLERAGLAFLKAEGEVSPAEFLVSVSWTLDTAKLEKFLASDASSRK